MRHSTNTGLSTSESGLGERSSGDGRCGVGSLGEKDAPSLDVSWSGREGRRPCAAAVSRLGVPALGRVELIPFCELPDLEVIGVGKASRYLGRRGSLPAYLACSMSAGVAIDAVGVGNICSTAVFRPGAGPLVAPGVLGPAIASDATGVGYIRRTASERSTCRLLPSGIAPVSDASDGSVLPPDVTTGVGKKSLASFTRPPAARAVSLCSPSLASGVLHLAATGSRFAFGREWEDPLWPCTPTVGVGHRTACVVSVGDPSRELCSGSGPFSESDAVGVIHEAVCRAWFPRPAGPSMMLLPRCAASGAVVGVAQRRDEGCPSSSRGSTPEKSSAICSSLGGLLSPPPSSVRGVIALADLRLFCASGVGHSRTASVSIVPGCITPVSVVWRAELEESVTVAVGQDPDAPTLVRGTNGARSEHRPLRIEPAYGKGP